MDGKNRSTRAARTDFETELIEFNGENNHVHLLVNFPPKVALAKLVNSLKGVSSRRMRQELPDGPPARAFTRALKGGALDPPPGSVCPWRC